MSQLNDKPDIVSYIVSHLDDFPAFAGIIESVAKITSSDELAVDDLTDVIIKDIALTSKVLRVVNSVVYRQYGEITTISRALMILGINNIKNLAIGLTFFHNLGSKHKSRLLADLLAKSLFSAFLAKHMVSADSDTRVMVEESFICSLFHSFGDILITFYYPALAEVVLNESLKQGVGKDPASSIVLGKSYADIGQEIAKKWHFPEILITNMQPLKLGAPNSNLSASERLRAIVTFSNKIGDILISDLSQDEKRKKIDALSQRFAGTISNSNGQIQDLIFKSFAEMINQSDVFNLDLSNSALIKYYPVSEEETEDKTAASAIVKPIELTRATSAVTSFDSLTETLDENADAMFSKGIQDISNAFFDNFSLNNIIGIAIETIHRSFYTLGGLNTIFFVKDKELSLMKYRFGFGQDMNSMKIWFKILLEDHNNIFSAVFSDKKDILIRDINAEDIKTMLPPLYARKIFDKRYVIMLPVMPANKPLGLIYIDGDSHKLDSITNNHFNYLRILRDQIIVAIRQKM